MWILRLCKGSNHGHYLMQTCDVIHDCVLSPGQVLPMPIKPVTILLICTCPSRAATKILQTDIPQHWVICPTLRPLSRLTQLVIVTVSLLVSHWYYCFSYSSLYSQGFVCTCCSFICAVDKTVHSSRTPRHVYLDNFCPSVSHKRAVFILKSWRWGNTERNLGKVFLQHWERNKR